MEEVPDGAASETILPNGDTNFFWGSNSCLKVNNNDIYFINNHKSRVMIKGHKSLVQS